MPELNTDGVLGRWLSLMIRGLGSGVCGEMRTALSAGERARPKGERTTRPGNEGRKGGSARRNGRESEGRNRPKGGHPGLD